MKCMNKKLSEEMRKFFSAAGRSGQKALREKIGEEAYRELKRKAQGARRVGKENQLSTNNLGKSVIK